MTLHEYVAAFCPDGPRQLRRLIRERTGVQLPYAYVWKWCNPERPCSLSLENATLVHTATDGQCSMEELQTLRKRLGIYGADSSKRAKRRRASSTLRRLVAELEREIAQAAPPKRSKATPKRLPSAAPPKRSKATPKRLPSAAPPKRSKTASAGRR